MIIHLNGFPPLMQEPKADLGPGPAAPPLIGAAARWRRSRLLPSPAPAPLQSGSCPKPGPLRTAQGNKAGELSCYEIYRYAVIVVKSSRFLFTSGIQPLSVTLSWIEQLNSFNLCRWGGFCLMEGEKEFSLKLFLFFLSFFLSFMRGGAPSCIHGLFNSWCRFN